MPLFLFIAGFLLLLLGLGMLSAGWFLREPPPPDAFAWQAPLEQVRTQNLIPATVLLALTGMPGADALNASLDEGHWENAYALIAYDSGLGDPTRIGALLQLGSRYADARDKGKAAWCYLYAARIATISPFLSDAVRLDTYLQVGAGLRSVGAHDAARMAIDQAYLVAQYSPVLRRQPQARRLDQIANAYAQLGMDTLAAQVSDQAKEALVAATEGTVFPPREPFVIKVGGLPASTSLASATQTRVAAARQLVEDVGEIRPNRASDWPSDSVAQLRTALVDEDQERRAFYDQHTAQVKDHNVLIALLRDKASWLGLKYRVARGAFGADLVPEWSEKTPALMDEWSDAFGELFKAYVDQAAAISDDQGVSRAMEDVLRQELLALRWGWYDGTPEEELRESLGQATGRLRQGAVPSLWLDAVVLGGKKTDLLVPGELYGKNEQAIPH